MTFKMQKEKRLQCLENIQYMNTLKPWKKREFSVLLLTKLFPVNFQMICFNKDDKFSFPYTHTV